jgi:hypothetical protein
MNWTILGKIGGFNPGGSLTIKDNRMCVPIAKNRPPNADLIRAIANKTKELSPLKWTGLSDDSSRPDETVVPDSLYSGFAITPGSDRVLTGFPARLAI